MKKKWWMMFGAAVLSVSMAAGCGDTQATSVPASEAATEAVSDAPAAADATTEMANPWVDVTREEALANCVRLFKAPEGAERVKWRMLEGSADPGRFVGPMVELDFTLDGLSYTARAQQGAAEDADIAGLYYEWTTTEEGTMANWGEGRMPVRFYRYIGDKETVDLCTWYDVEIGIAYSLSVAAPDLDGFDLQAVAESMYDETQEPMSEVPEDFLQSQAGKTSFDSFEDAISSLTTGQGYAYIKLYGSEEELLAVTNLVFEADKTAYEASIYAMRDGKAVNIGNVSGNGSSYPLRLADGILYSGDNHLYESWFLTADQKGLMLKDMIDDGVHSGENTYSGFLRETNDFEHDVEFTGGEAEFQEYLTKREAVPAIEFTVIPA